MMRVQSSEVTVAADSISLSDERSVCFYGIHQSHPKGPEEAPEHVRS